MITEIERILKLKLLEVDNYSIKVYTILLLVLVFVLVRIVQWILKKAILQNRSIKEDVGSRYAVYQLVKYVIWIIAIVIGLDIVGIKITVFLAGSAALLVGIGLGLQQTFNDIVSGVILLSERSIQVDDILQLDNDIVKIQKIGLRTSLCLNRDDISIIIPNSLISNNKVINWSHQDKKARFKINVGVAYGSDAELVISLLKQCALEHPEVNNAETIDARLVDFGNSSINFQLLFYSSNIFRIEKVKSEIRLLINKKFTENKITIPFPQLDLYVKSMPASANL